MSIGVNYHNSRSLSLKPAVANELRLKIYATILELAPNFTHEQIMHNAIAHALLSYAQYRGYTSQALTKYLCSKIGASISLQQKIRSRSLDICPDSCGYLIDHIFQAFLEGMPISGNLDNRSENHRKALGAFYTPYEIAFYICSKTIKSFTAGQKIVDPACGTGVFLSSAAHHLCEQDFSINEICDALHGWDKNETPLKISPLLILLELGASEKNILSNKMANNFVCKDSLLEESARSDLFSLKQVKQEEKFDYIVANPPYDRLKPDKLSGAARQEVLQYADRLRKGGEYPLSTSGSLELYRLFMERIFNLSMKSSGRAGIIVPKSFAGDKNACEMRREFVSQNILESILFIPEKVRAFNGVSQAFAIVIWDAKRKSKKIKVGTCHQLRNLDSSIKNSTPVDKVISAFPAGINLIDAPEEAYSLIEHLNKMPQVQSITWIKNKRGEVDLTFYKDILGTGQPKLLRGRGIGEYRISEYDFIDFEALAQRLKSSDKLNDLMMPRLVCQQISNMDSSKRLKFAPVDSGIALGNSLNYLVCLNQEKAIFYGLLGIMNSILIDWRFRITSSNNHVNNYEIDLLPLPNAPSEIRELGKFVELNLLNLENPETRLKIEEQVLELYNAEKYRNLLIDHHPAGHLLNPQNVIRDKNAKAA